MALETGRLERDTRQRRVYSSGIFETSCSGVLQPLGFTIAEFRLEKPLCRRTCGPEPLPAPPQRCSNATSSLDLHQEIPGKELINTPHSIASMKHPMKRHTIPLNTAEVAKFAEGPAKAVKDEARQKKDPFCMVLQ